MNYAKLARAMRLYYEKKILVKSAGNFVYKSFNSNTAPAHINIGYLRVKVD